MSSSSRIRAALVELIAERGYPHAELEDLLERAGLDAPAFHRHYESLDACFAEVWQAYTEEFFARAELVQRAAGSWREGVRAQAWELYRFLSEDPVRARICLVEVNFAGATTQAKRDRFMDAYVELIHLGRFESERAREIPRAQAEAMVGAIWERAAGDASAGHFDAPELVPQMLYLLFLPYLGPDAALEEMRRASADLDRLRRGEL